MQRVSSDTPPTRADPPLSYREALFDAMYSTISQSSSLETPLTMVGKSVANIVGVAGVATPTLGNREDTDLTLKGAWSHLWERQLQRCKYMHVA